MAGNKDDDAADGAAAKARLYVPDDLAAGREIALAPPQAHYLRNVMRLAAGDDVVLFNGRHGEFRARLTVSDKKRAAAMPAALLRPQRDEAGPRLFFAPIKRPRLEAVIEKATELGAASLHPVMTRRTIVHRLNEDRLRAIAVEAAEQCERLTIPTLASPIGLPALAADWPARRHLLVCAEKSEVRPIAQILTERGDYDAFDLLIGPEGGFEEAELDGLAKLSFVSFVGLGPRILRADTAALAALAIVQSLAVDARGRPPRRD